MLIHILHFLLGLFLIFFVSMGCSEDGSNDGPKFVLTDARFVTAVERDATLCQTAQQVIAGIDASVMTSDMVALTMHQTPTAFVASSSRIDAAITPPINIAGYTAEMTVSVPDAAVETLATEIMCKLKSHDEIEYAMGVAYDGNEQTCRHINQMTIDWAMSQLTEDELERYQNEGNTLVVGDDIAHNGGASWVGSCSEWTVGAAETMLQAAALVVVRDEHPEIEDDKNGVHYCKLLAPSQALYWVLERAYRDTPLAPGTNDGDDAELSCTVSETVDCRLSDAVAAGSCIFYAAMASQHLCEEYTGSGWTESDAIDKCASREEGLFATQACSDRFDELSDISDDGVLKGDCVIDCGGPGEYYWKVYNDVPGVNVGDYCTDWFPLQ